MPASSGGEVTRHFAGDIPINTSATRPRMGFDAYQTDPRVAMGYLAQFPLRRRPRRVLDAGAGVGVWTQSLRTFYDDVHVTGVDIQRGMMPARLFDRRLLGDFLTMPIVGDPAHGGDGFDLVGFNWPYGSKTNRNLLEQFFTAAFYLTPPEGNATILALTRLNWLGSRRRLPMFTSWAQPTGVYVMSRRPVFLRGVPGNDEDGGSLDPVYGRRSYPTEFALIKWELVDRCVYPNTAMHWFDYDPTAGDEDVIEQLDLDELMLEDGEGDDLL